MAHPQPVVSASYPYIRIRFSLRGQEREVSALADTGFSGDLVIPATFLNGALGSADAWSDWELADGSVVTTPLYSGTVEIIGLGPVTAAIAVMGEDYILGTGIMARYSVTFDHGQRVIVEP